MEAVKNANLPNIEIYYDPEAGSKTGKPEAGGLDTEALARAIGYGIEEEGLPCEMIGRAISREEACELTKRPGLGVVILVSDGRASVYARQLKSAEPIFDLTAADRKAAGIVGKNAARIVKNKPFIEIE